MLNRERIAFSSFILFLFLSYLSPAQFIDPREAKEFYNHQNYSSALKEYNKLLTKEPNNADYNHKMGICYLKTNIDKAKAIPYLERAIRQPKFDTEALFDLAFAYQLNYQFDKALEKYLQYKKIASGKQMDKVDRQIETCYTAKELIKFPVNVHFENLGKTVNTPYPDYYPFVSKDGEFLTFTSRRQENVDAILEFDGFYPSDVWYAILENNKVKAVKNAGFFLNGTYDEQTVGLSDDGKLLFVYVDNLKEVGDIYTSEKNASTFKKKEKLGNNVNSVHLETSASISLDGNTLFFASNRPGGKGKLDIYMSRKLPTGEWAEPQNLGDNVNTQYNEDFPSLSADGKTLYFCSQGHENMGGYDIFKTTWNEEDNSWSNPKNLGYPLNTPDDNMTISFTENNRIAYTSAFRKDSYGDFDIYRVIFNDVTPDYTVFKINLPTTDTLNPFITDAMVTVESTNNNDLIGDYRPQSNGSYIVILAPGKYNLIIDAIGYAIYNEEIVVLENLKNEPIFKSITLSKK